MASYRQANGFNDAFEQGTDGTTCVDDDCPLPEHQGPCPTFATVEEERDAWRREAKRARRRVGELWERARHLDDTLKRIFDVAAKR